MLGRGGKAHLGLQLGQRRVGADAARLQGLELLLQGVSRQLVAPKLNRGLGLGLDLVHPFAHALEGVEGVGVGQAAHGVLDGLLGLGALLARDEDVLLALGLLDLVVERAQLLLQLLDRVLLQLPLLGELGLLLVVLAACGSAPPCARLSSLARTASIALRSHSCTSSTCSSHCFFQALLVRDRDRHLLLRLDKLVLHVDDDLVQHLLRVFRLGDQIVQVRFDERAEPRKNSHD
jgi:hypothetical protein